MSVLSVDRLLEFKLKTWCVSVQSNQGNSLCLLTRNSQQFSWVCSAAQVDPQFQDTMVIVRQQLAAKGAGPDIQAYVEQLMLERHETYKIYATAETDKRRHLLDHVSRLEVSTAPVFAVITQ